MYIGLPGRVSQEASPRFLLSNSFLQMLRAEFECLRFKEIEDGLIICIDCFPSVGPLSGKIKRPRKIKDTRIRNQAGALVKLPTLHSAGIAIDHARLLRCKTQRDVAVFLSAEVKRQASLLFGKLPRFDQDAFCSHFEAAALRVPETVEA
jgi:hypothetical protein